MKKIGLSLLCIILSVAPTFAGGKTTLPYNIKKITDSSILNEKFEDINAGQIAITGGYVSGVGDTELYFYDDKSGIKLQLTDNNYHDSWAAVHNGRVAWRGQVPQPDETNVFQIFYYDGSTIRQLSQNGQYDSNITAPAINNGQVAWGQPMSYDGSIWGLFFYDGTTVRQIEMPSGMVYKGIVSIGKSSASMPFLSNGRIAITAFDGHDYEVLVWENGSFSQITNKSTNDLALGIDGPYVLISGYDGGADTEIFLWNGITMTQITNNNFDEYSNEVAMSNGWVAWNDLDSTGRKEQVFLWDGSSKRQISNNRYGVNSQAYLVMHNGQIAWTASDGNDGEVYVWNGSATYQLTNNSVSDYAYGINNGQVVFGQYVGTLAYGILDYEIYLATPK